MFPPEKISRTACPAHQVDAPHYLFDVPFELDPISGGIEVSDCSAAEFLEAKNGRLKLDVPHVRGEHKVEMRGTVPESWGLV